MSERERERQMVFFRFHRVITSAFFSQSLKMTNSGHNSKVGHPVADRDSLLRGATERERER